MLFLNSISVECTLKVNFKIRKINMDLCDIWSKTVHSMTNVSMKEIHDVIYDLSFYLMTFDLG